MQPLGKEILDGVSSAIAFGANLVTVVLGIIALWGLVFRRKQLSLALRLLVNIYLSQRVSRLKETLGRLDSLNYDNKEHRSEIHALLGQVCGQVASVVRDHPSLAPSHEKLTAFVDKRARISESKKRQLVYEIHGQLDSISFEETSTAIEQKDG